MAVRFAVLRHCETPAMEPTALRPSFTISYTNDFVARAPSFVFRNLRIRELWEHNECALSISTSASSTFKIFRDDTWMIHMYYSCITHAYIHMIYMSNTYVSSMYKTETIQDVICKVNHRLRYTTCLIRNSPSPSLSFMAVFNSFT